MKFVYTKNKQVKKQLEDCGSKLIKTNSNGIFIYALSPTSKFNFEKQKETWCSNTLTL